MPDDKVTVEAYSQQYQASAPNGLYVDLIDGHLLELGLFSRLQSHIITQLYARLNYHIDTHMGGAIFGMQRGYTLNDYTLIHPTISYVAPDSDLTDEDTGAPNLVVHVVDSCDATDDIQARVQLWLTHGAEMVWIVFADESCAELYSMSDGDMVVDELGFGDTLTAPDILPEFELPLFTIFPAKRL